MQTDDKKMLSVPSSWAKTVRKDHFPRVSLVEEFLWRGGGS